MYSRTLTCPRRLTYNDTFPSFFLYQPILEHCTAGELWRPSSVVLLFTPTHSVRSYYSLLPLMLMALDCYYNSHKRYIVLYFIRFQFFILS